MIAKDKIILSPSTTGIYLFWFEKKPIYIGKAVNIKARLLSHWRNCEHDSKERAIIETATSVTYKTTLSEFDSLLLEAHYIQKYRPKYNVAWKDDKSYLYIKILVREKYPKVSIVRAENDGRSKYFGPFTSTRVARLLLREIRRIVPFCMQKNLSALPCFYSKIGQCDPCPNSIEKVLITGDSAAAKILTKRYKSNIRQIIDILNVKSAKVEQSLQKEMIKKGLQHNFESAIALRNKIALLQTLITNRSFESTELETDQQYESLVQKEIIAFLKNHFQVIDKKKQYRIECYDISNLTGTNATGSMVVFTNSKSDKKQYRKFKIKTVSTISDFAMLSEVISRRIKRDDWPHPDILVVDGGRPQLRAVYKIISKEYHDFPIHLVGIAKHPDRLFSGIPPFRPISMANYPTLFKVIQAIRDESHRFAKKYHLFLRKDKLLI